MGIARVPGSNHMIAGWEWRCQASGSVDNVYGSQGGLSDGWIQRTACVHKSNRASGNAGGDHYACGQGYRIARQGRRTQRSVKESQANEGGVSRGDRAEDPGGRVGGTRVIDEIKSVCITHVIGAKGQTACSAKDQRISASIGQLTCEGSRTGIERADAFVATRIGDQDVVAKWTEVRAGLRDSPRRVQGNAWRDKSPHEVADGVEDVDEATSTSSKQWLAITSLRGIHHENLVSNYLNVERSKTWWEIWIDEGIRCKRTEREWIAATREGVDEALGKICSRNIRTAAVRLDESYSGIACQTR